MFSVDHLPPRLHKVLPCASRTLYGTAYHAPGRQSKDTSQSQGGHAAGTGQPGLDTECHGDESLRMGLFIEAACHSGAGCTWLNLFKRPDAMVHAGAAERQCQA